MTYRLGLERVPAQKGEELCGFIVDLVLFPPAKTEPKSNENPVSSHYWQGQLYIVIKGQL